MVSRDASLVSRAIRLMAVACVSSVDARGTAQPHRRHVAHRRPGCDAVSPGDSGLTGRRCAGRQSNGRRRQRMQDGARKPRGR
jgi:hypothetical protein